MFDQAERGLTLSDRAYETTVRSLRTKLLAAHFALRETQRQVVLIVSGADGAGKGELVHRFAEWLDPRGLVTHAFWDDSDEESERPHFYRFWKAMPGAGRVGVFFGSWYTRPIIERVARVRRKREFIPELDRIVAFERMLTQGNTTFVKLWLHLSKKAQRARLEENEKEGKIGPDDWAHFEQYDRFREVSERALIHTNERWSPWQVIDATDRRHREVAAGKALLGALLGALKGALEVPLEGALKGALTGTLKRTLKGTPTVPDETLKGTQKGTPKRASVRECHPAASVRSRANASDGAARRLAGVDQAGSGNGAPRTYEPGPSILDAVDLSQRLSPSRYDDEMDDLQGRLTRLTWSARKKKVAMVLAFEGWDAAGKGSAIRRVTWAIDPRLYRVIGVAAPTDEEQAQHYLWRFWRHIPRDGRITIFDRSWYGRVLVERVEGFSAVADWDRSYDEINSFERQLTDHGIALAKFWIHISPDEQLRRFKERQRVAYKRFKITPDDWRNRKKLPAYRLAVEEMLARCESPDAPWTVVAGNDKRFARVQILRTVCDRLERALG